jgi:hypothetical protein
VARDVEHFFMCFLAICTSSFENALFSPFANFFIGSLILWETTLVSSFPWMGYQGKSEVN